MLIKKMYQLGNLSLLLAVSKSDQSTLTLIESSSKMQILKNRMNKWQMKIVLLGAWQASNIQIGRIELNLQQQVLMIASRLIAKLTNKPLVV